MTKATEKKVCNVSIKMNSVNNVGPQAIQLSLMQDEEVIDLVRAGSIESFEILMRRYNRRLYRVVRGVLGGNSEVEDVVQEAYVRAYIHLDQFAGHAKFSTWLTKIALYEAMARARRGRRFEQVNFMSEDIDEPNVLQHRGRSPEQMAYDRELHAILENAVDALPSTYRTVFMMREVEGMSSGEVAECLDTTEEAVRTRLHRARHLLQERLQEQLGAACATAFPFAGGRCNAMVAGVLRRIALLKRP